MSKESEQTTDSVNLDELRGRISKIQWFHNWELLPGVMTNGWSKMSDRLPHFQIPEDMSGKRVLDIGCADGYFSFLAEARGADVVSIDSTPRSGYFVAHDALNSQAEFFHMSVYDIDPDILGMFDIVFFFGVYYHLKHPLLALERIASVTREYALIESEVTDLSLPHNAAASLFFEFSELNNDPTNWWAPNIPCLIQTVRSAGFTQAELVGQYADGFRAVVRAEKGPRTAGKVLSEDITLILDTPLPGDKVSGETTISGWTLNQLAPQDGIERISIYLDKLDDPAFMLGEAEYRRERGDLAPSVNSIYGDVGFQFVWNVDDSLSGRHNLHILVEGRGLWQHKCIPVFIGESDEMDIHPPLPVEQTHIVSQEAIALRQILAERDAEIKRLQTLITGYEQGKFMRMMARLHKMRPSWPDQQESKSERE